MHHLMERKCCLMAKPHYLANSSSYRISQKPSESSSHMGKMDFIRGELPKRSSTWSRAKEVWWNLRIWPITPHPSLNLSNTPMRGMSPSMRWVPVQAVFDTFSLCDAKVSSERSRWVRRTLMKTAQFIPDDKESLLSLLWVSWKAYRSKDSLRS